MASQTGLLQLPVELIVGITEHLRSERDLSRLSRSHRVLRRITEPLLYRHNVRYDNGRALIEGLVSGNLATAEKALDWGGSDINIVWSTVDPRLMTRRFLEKQGGGISAQRSSRAQQIWNDYTEVREYKFTPLDFTVLYQRPESLRLLLARGAVPEAGLLHMTAHVGDEASMTILLEHRNARSLHDHYRGTGTRAGKTLLELAVDGAHLDTARVILEHEPDTAARQLGNIMTSPLFRPWPPFQVLAAAEQARFEALVTLLNDHGARVHEWRHRNWDGSEAHTLCLLATAARDVKKLRFLLAGGLTTPADVRRAVQRLTALHVAAAKAETETVRFFLGLGLDDEAIQSKDDRGWTVLETALRGAFSWPRIEPGRVFDTVRALLEHPAVRPLVSVTVKDTPGVTPMLLYLQRVDHEFAGWEEDDATSKITADGEETGTGGSVAATQDSRGTATQRWCARTIQLLIDAGANVTATYGLRHDERYGVLDEALRHGCPGCGEVVLAHFSCEQVTRFIAKARAEAKPHLTVKFEPFEKLVKEVRLRQVEC
ncbi:hypothetical protein Micbo1qcDRAFT_200451 [Microdochium bolleyi]|uniref:Uncharacterized protein n=1 Tax=Microdochium bolleyi TaxID=196109 RepID=A0A136JCW2_9PEZI|nr:hypothetical protein Micbo1qcDRAFT_200451 [Microdochium bolleyi]